MPAWPVITCMYKACRPQKMAEKGKGITLSFVRPPHILYKYRQQLEPKKQEETRKMSPLPSPSIRVGWGAHLSHFLCLF